MVWRQGRQRIRHQYGNACDIEGYGVDNVHSTHVEEVEFHGVNMVGNYSAGLKILSMPGNDYEVSPSVFVQGATILSGAR